MVNTALLMEWFVFTIFVVKVGFVGTGVAHRLLSRKKRGEKAEKLDERFEYWHQRAEFLFDVGIGALLIYHFRKFGGVCSGGSGRVPISSETALLFFLFGCLTILSADWKLLFDLF